MHPTLALQCFEWHFKWAASQFPTPCCKCGVTRFAAQVQGQGPRLQGMLGLLTAPQNREQWLPKSLPRGSMPCSPWHGAGPGWLSEPAGSKHTEQGSCPAACCQQLLHTWAQFRHSWAQLGTAHHDLTRARRRVQHLAQPWTEGLGSGPWAGLGQAAHREPLWGGIMQH